MAQPEPEHRYTPAEYLALERAAETKSEYLDGQIFAMAGASRRHNLIVANVIARLTLQLEHRPCEVYSGDMRSKVPATGLSTRPAKAGMACRWLRRGLTSMLRPVFR